MDFKKIPHKLIGDILVEEGFVSAERITDALGIQKKEGGLIGEILIREGWVSEENLVLALSRQMGIPFMRLTKYVVNRDAVKLIQKSFVSQAVIFPFEKNRLTISLAVADPSNTKAFAEIQEKTGLGIHVFLCTVSDIKQAIEQYYGSNGKDG